MAFDDVKANVAKTMLAFKNVRIAGVVFRAQSLAASQEATELSRNQVEALNAASAPMETALAGFNTFLRASLLKHLEYGADVIARPYQTVPQILQDFVRYCVANGHYVKARRVKYGAAPAHSSTGLYRRLTVNTFGQSIENRNHNTTTRMRVKSTEVSGAFAGRTKVAFEGTNKKDASTLNIKGPGVTVETDLIGPSNPGILQNAVLSGNPDTDDGDDIVDGDATTGGIPGWDQTRTGTPQVKVETSIKYRAQPYGVAVRVPSSTFKISQPMEGLNLTRGIPVAIAKMVYQDGASITGDYTIGWGANTQVFNETHTSNGVWTPLIVTMDKKLYPENMSATAGQISFQLAFDAYADTGQRIILGGMYVARMFQLEEGGEWYIGWEHWDEPADDAETAFGADSQTSEGPEQEMWCQAFPEGPSLPITGSTLWFLTESEPEIVFISNDTDVSNGGTVLLGSVPSGPHNITFTFRNDGLAPLVISVPVEDSPGTNADLTDTGIADPIVIPPGESRDMTIEITDGGAGAFSQTVRFDNNDGNESPFTMSFAGTAT